MTTGEVIALIKAFGGSGGGSSGGGVLVVHDVHGTLDKTWQEIKDAGFAILNLENTIGYLYNITSADGYEVDFFSVALGPAFDDPLGYVADTASGYPVAVDA